jgi:L-threonylcarbamoyladenylate synthase
MSGSGSQSDIERAADAVRDGDLVVDPTETVYGLGADALDPEAVERVFATKGRDRENPVSMAVPDVETAAEYTELGGRERAFMRQFLPGPVTVVVERGDRLPDALTAGRDRVGVRVPDHDLALSLLGRVAPVTATSANASGRPSVRQTSSLHEQVRRAASVVVDDGETPGGGSTVVDVGRGTVHRRGALADRVEDWLSDR